MANRIFLVNLDLSGNQLLNFIVQNLGTDPGSPAVGQTWYNTTSNTLKYYNGAVKTIADLSAVVNTISAANTSITIGGTATAPTVSTGTFDLVAAQSPAAGNVTINNHRITNVLDPVAANDVVNLQTLQAYVAGLSDRASVVYATAAALPSNTYANGASGVGATLTATANAALVVDGQTVVAGQRILVLNEAAPANNGIYVVTTVGSAGAAYVLTRATDFNVATVDGATQIGTGALIPVEAPTGVTAGTTNNNRIFISVVASPVTVGTTAISFTAIGSTYSAGTGLTLTGTTFSLTIPVVISSGGTGAITAAAARTNLGVGGQFTGSLGDGSSLSYVITHNLGNQYPNVRFYRTSDSSQVEPGVVATSTNSMTVTFAVAPTTSSIFYTIDG